ncbi:flippase [Halomarina litorea]|uniref:flippase n=1 Tax=Halomarina litorea TaxID=2961595 RepID=UPI0020C3D04C|nr:flippase [Halomarina sp. BCD28]
MGNSDPRDSLRTLFKGGSVLFLGLLLELAISFVAKLVIARVLGRVDYGAVSLGITLTAFVSTLVVLGLHTGIGRFLPRYEDPGRRKGVLLSAFELAIPLSVLVGGAIALLAPWLAGAVFDDSSIAPVLRVFGLAIPLAAVMKLAVGGVQGLQSSLPKVFIRNVSLPLTRFAGVVVAILLGFRSTGVAWAYAASYAAAAGVGLYFLWRDTPLFDRAVEAVPMRRELLSFSAPLVVSTTMTLVFSDIDMFMLGIYASTGDVGVYNTVYPLAQLLTVAMSAFGFIFMPVVSELQTAGEEDALGRLYQVVTKWIFLATFPLFVLMVLFPEATIALTFGPEYLPGTTALVVLSVAFFTHAIAGPNADALTSLGRTRLIMYDNALVAAVNVVLNVALIPQYTFLGAAVATAVSYVLLNALYAAQLYRFAGFHPVTGTLARIAALSGFLAVALYLAVTSAFADPVVQLAVAGSVFAVCYAVVALRFGVEEEEVMLLLSFEERFGVDLGPLRAIATRLMD